MEWLPVQVTAACEKQAEKTILSERTGLSPAQLSTRGLAVKYLKRQRRAAQHTLRWLAAFLQAKGLPDDRVRQVIADSPQTPLAALLYGFQNSAFQPVPLAQDYAARWDRLIEQAKGLCVEGDLEGYRKALLAFIKEEVGDSLEHLQHGTWSDVTRRLNACDDWYGLVQVTDRMLLAGLTSILAAWDVDWSARCCSRFDPVPTLPWLMPRTRGPSRSNRCNPAVDDATVAARLRVNVERPAFRLLQLLWVVASRMSCAPERWPAALPGSKRLALDLGSGSVDCDEATMRKVRIGTRRLSADEVFALWNSFAFTLGVGVQKGTKRREAPAPDFPAPAFWIVVALWMDNCWLQRLPLTSHLRSADVLDAAAYGELWRLHRFRWRSQLPEAGRLPWPHFLSHARL